jgi:hypothetical protein
VTATRIENVTAEQKRIGVTPTHAAAPVFDPRTLFPEASGAMNKTAIALSIIAAGGAGGVGIDDIERGFSERGQPLHRNYLFNITSRLKQQGRIEQRDRRYYLKP